MTNSKLINFKLSTEDFLTEGTTNKAILNTIIKLIILITEL